MSESIVFFAEGDSPEMLDAAAKAQATFKYFWRELSWEHRRIIPGLNVACVKVPFAQQFPGDDKPTVEHMWINDISFDGDNIYGILINDPNSLTNVSNGDEITVPLNQISDWLFAIDDRAYGGFTIQAMRAGMTEEERQDHDEAWGLEFGDYNRILVVNKEEENPENLVEHPMSKNMKPSFVDFLQQNPGELNSADEAGFTLLHKESIAGNLSIVEVLLQQGADTSKQTQSGKTALDFAKQLKWEHLIPVLEGK
ncbi:DUF2314 domain-containing protein [Chitinophaga qingshengii]|uniref:DUF2314 domain-containing protein n=1 Tax=Chitinophaga qingshengii TaxID=1569794 RepID=A0ABR7TQC5_9BACT|nr:DUF2314 domain-containing protein [Chitinophaga qingshengii]MBC9931798.1 DUF2314 domain-containing protein [Chitinophaga qingshengii]